MDKKLTDLLAFIDFTHQIREVKRSMWNRGSKQFENDSEHSFQLAITALYVIDENQLQLDAFRAMSLALVHDAVEVYSGDTCAFRGKTQSQHDREAKAIKQLKESWPKQKLLHSLVDEYEQRTSPEAKFVYALDKLIPMLNNYSDGGRNWSRGGITLAEIIKVKTGKADSDPEIAKYYRALLEVLKTKPELFLDNQVNKQS
jgi:putative hydrolases of HD superfamily